MEKTRMLMRCVKHEDGFQNQTHLKTIYENVAYGLRVNGITDKMKLKSALLLLLNKWRFGMIKDKLKNQL
jgi:ABC-type phosphate transport system ATPase subunit